MGIAGASALVIAMANDGWSSARSWIGHWLGRGRGQEESHSLALLDRDRQLLLVASDDDQADEAQRLVATWGVRLQDIADMDQDAAVELMQWVSRWQAENQGKQPGVRQKAKASGRARITQIGGNQTNLSRGQS